ncbi:enoyl-CoA hydratase/isomerase family protein [Ottowia sp.]|uniref:enoyl-CoA hydratase/isomerase family protein n=1 Tax=Ottowia sp. TaxID=1898956 RepID=UPI002BCE1155|nr:enoyl-CoA hydratase/isomerase family protein [Ottowia sp.]HRN77040.1 enoyl-CoA hydratase/isomerase family protein [Ottowia sp.]HRQ02997.1 enoyl-CoA hydratase/isomerase family protein [Ottowia sp.]
MSGRVLFAGDQGVAVVTLSHRARFNAMSRAMWRELKDVFSRIQLDAQWRCVLLHGDGGHFCAGGDIAEYPDFRFDRDRLRTFHEDEVWGGLAAMLACDVPIVAAIGGNCMGAGVEIASCCDIRVAAEDARFGAPIARLGFPMAPREARLVARVAGEATARELLLEAAVLDAPELKARGFLHQVLPPFELMVHARQRAARIARLAPQAARLNKQTLRALGQAGPGDAAGPAIDRIVAGAYDYADSAEHREGITAFLAKRAPNF